MQCVFRDKEIRSQALRVALPALWGKNTAVGKAQYRTVRDGNFGLGRTFAIGGTADESAPVIGVQRCGKDLGSAGRVRSDQKDDRHASLVSGWGKNHAPTRLSGHETTQ
mgnify:FL=1